MSVRALTLAGLPALLVRPRGARALLVLAHGAGAGMRHAFMEGIATALAAEAIATVRWELPFMAAGSKRPDSPAVAQAAVRDVWAAAHARFGAALPMFAGGKSFGGRMTSGAHATAPLPGCAGLVLVGFPLHPPGQPARAVARAAHLPRTRGRLLFLQGARDALADLALLRPVVTALGRRATLHVVAHADHGFDVRVRSGRTSADVLGELARTTAAWMARGRARA